MNGFNQIVLGFCVERMGVGASSDLVGVGGVGGVVSTGHILTLEQNPVKVRQNL